MTDLGAEVVDNSVEAMEARLRLLQEPLGVLMTEACALFDDVFPQAGHPVTRPSYFPIYRTMSMNLCPQEGIPMLRELTVLLGAGKRIQIFRNSQGAPDNYPRKMLWVVKPKPEGEGKRKTTVLSTHAPSRSDLPLDIEVADYSPEGIFEEIVGEPYHDKEQFVEEGKAAIGEAAQVAEKLMPRPLVKYRQLVS